MGVEVVAATAEISDRLKSHSLKYRKMFGSYPPRWFLPAHARRIFDRGGKEEAYLSTVFR